MYKNSYHSSPLCYFIMSKFIEVLPDKILVASVRVRRLHYVTKDFSFLYQTSTVVQRMPMQVVPPGHHAFGGLLPRFCLSCLILLILAAVYYCYFNRMSQAGSPNKVRKLSRKSKIIVKLQALQIKIAQSLLLCLKQI